MIDRTPGRLAALLLVALVLSMPNRTLCADGQTRLAMSGVDGGRALLTLADDPLRTMTPTPFHLILTDLAGTPVTGARVRCEMTMPAMAMPENRPSIRESDGAYWGEALFTMAGEWRAEFHIGMPDGRLEILVFDIERVLLK